MSRLASYQSGAPASGTNYYGGPSASISATVGGSVSAGDARWTGLIVVVALAIAVLGWHGLKT